MEILLNDQQVKEFENAQNNFGILNAQAPGDIYKKIPCSISYTYIRFEVDGTVKPCCVVPFRFGNINDSKLDVIWHSSEYYSWREKFLKIHKDQFHFKDTEFGFCQICPHVPINLEAARLLSIERN
jgi:radical SAM protein with 4Fe4S-binding SPASM domain